MRAVESLPNAPAPTEQDPGLIKLLRRLVLKRDLLRQGDPAHEHIRTGILVDGGSMRGVYTGGVVTALHQFGMTEVFDYAVGISAGAAGCAYFLAGQAEMGTSIYYEDLIDKRFINLKRVRKILDLDYLFHVIRSVKPLDLDRVRKSRTHLLIGVTNAETGLCTYLDARDPDLDLMAAFQASAALPIVYNRAIQINGVPYTDGASGCGLPVNYLVNELGCTDSLVIMNQPISEKGGRESLLETVLVTLFSRHFSPALRSAYIGRNKLYDEGTAFIRTYRAGGSPVNIGVIAPEEGLVGRLTTDKTLLKDVARRSEQQMLAALHEAERTLQHSTS